MMLKAYVMIILQVIIGPLQIMLDLIPGQQGFGPWLRNLIANASVFVAVPVMLLLQNVLATNFFTARSWGIADFGQSGGTQLQLPYVGWEGNVLLSWAIGFVIFAITPKIADMIRDALKVPAFKYESAIGEAFMEPYKWYQNVVNHQKGQEDRKLQITKLGEAKVKQEFMAGGIGGVIDRSRQEAQAAQTKATAATSAPRTSSL
jgi:hypothetical protein